MNEVQFEALGELSRKAGAIIAVIQANKQKRLNNVQENYFHIDCGFNNHEFWSLGRRKETGI
jgi:hypothetical protein